MRGLGANSLSLATLNVVWGLKKTVAMDEQQGFSSSVTKAVGKLVEFQSTSSSAEGAGLDLGQPPQKLAEPRTHHFTLHSEAQGASAWCGGEKLAFFSFFVFCAFLSLPPTREDPFKLFQTQSSKNHRVELSGSFKCAKERDGLKKNIFFSFFWRRRKEPVCVLRLPCDSGSCLLAGASIPTQLDWGATLPGAAKRANETTKKHKMNR